MIAIKIDVDTHDGMARGVPRLLDALAAHRLRASFFLALGPDRSGLALVQMLRSPRFVVKMLATSAPSMYGWRTIFSGTVLPARPVATAFPDLARRIADAGHEPAVHAWDHRAWQDNLRTFKDGRVRAHFRRAVAAFRALYGGDPEGVAAPAWMTTAASLRIEDEFPFRYASDLRGGGGPCRLRVDGEVRRLPQYPSSALCAEEFMGLGVRSHDALAEALTRALARDPSPVRILTLHAEVEGGPLAPILDRVLPRLAAMDEVVTLAEAARRLGEDLPVRDWRMRRIPGRAFPVSATVAPQTAR